MPGIKLKKKKKSNTPPIPLVQTEAMDFQLRETVPEIPAISSQLQIQTTSTGQYEALTTKGETATDLMGIEYEGYFAPTTIQARQIYKYLESIAPGSISRSENNSIGGPYSGPFYSANSLRRTVQNRIFQNLSKLIHGNPHADGGGVECVLKPATMSAYIHLKEEITYILSVYKAFGFTDAIPGAGIHINVDFSMFGASAKEQRQTMANFLWFAFINNDFIVELSQRRFSDTWRVDMWNQIGDVLALDVDSSVKNFIQSKNVLLDAVEQGDALRTFNLHAHRDGRPALEIRWFGSTQNSNRLMMMLEFVHCVIHFCKAAGDNQQKMSLSQFAGNVRKNAAMYPHLHEYMDENPYSQQYMRLSSSFEQQPQRENITVDSIA